MFAIPLIIKEAAGLTRIDEPVQVGVPFPMGKVINFAALSLQSSEGLSIPFNIATTTNWPDGSCRWAMVDFQASVAANQTTQYWLKNDSGNSGEVLAGAIKSTLQQDIHLELNNADMRMVIATGTVGGNSSDKSSDDNSGHKGLIESLAINNQQVIDQCQLQLIDQTGNSQQPQINSISLRPDSSSLRTTVDLAGHYAIEQQPAINFKAAITSYSQKPWLKWELTLHNPKAAHHENGMWDLGDPGSVYFKALKCVIKTKAGNNKPQWKEQPQAPWQPLPTDSLTLHQHSSGGANWQSSNHVNASGNVPLQIQGYQINQGAIEPTGERATPLTQSTVHNTAGDTTVGLYMPQFWHNFPKAVSLSEQQLELALFPEHELPPHEQEAHKQELHELQGGESKTHTFYTYFSDCSHHLAAITNPLQCTISPGWLAEANALMYFTAGQGSEALDGLIHKGIAGDDTFFTKREKADEYGWRNFGDLPADHESLYKEGQDFVSHYNNQYDPIYGFARQYLLTGDARWKELLDDLAQHVKDIDIYHTELDRAEYNQGLFWHTDHYLEAYTSSHRTYSKQQLADTIYESHGGGPGGQHCYTTGLLYHYFLTGNPTSKEAVFSLTNWVTHFYEGDGSMLDTLVSFKNRHLVGYKNNFSSGHQYPLDRGIGNYITALLDCFAIDNDLRHLHRVEHIIQNTVHPEDDIPQRAFDDVENTWFYTVFLQALIRYLHTKELLDQHDYAYSYARDTLLHYATWMSKHEQPYLAKPEILEFPNHTWAAQEIRKSNVLYAAWHYFTDTSSGGSSAKENLLARADEFYNYVVDTLATEPTASYTRLLALLMQSHGARAFYLAAPQNATGLAAIQYGPAPLHDSKKTPVNFITKLIKQCSRLSYKKERNWIKTRFMRAE